MVHVNIYGHIYICHTPFFVCCTGQRNAVNFTIRLSRGVCSSSSNCKAQGQFPVVVHNDLCVGTCMYRTDGPLRTLDVCVCVCVVAWVGAAIHSEKIVSNKNAASFEQRKFSSVACMENTRKRFGSVTSTRPFQDYEWCLGF